MCDAGASRRGARRHRRRHRQRRTAPQAPTRPRGRGAESRRVRPLDRRGRKVVLAHEATHAVTGAATCRCRCGSPRDSPTTSRSAVVDVAGRGGCRAGAARCAGERRAEIACPSQRRRSRGSGRATRARLRAVLARGSQHRAAVRRAAVLRFYHRRRRRTPSLPYGSFASELGMGPRRGDAAAGEQSFARMADA